MLVAAASSFWLRDDGSFSWIHGLSVWIVISVLVGAHAMRRGNRPAHQGWMVGAYLGLVVAGAFALSPDRLLGGLVFGG